MCIGGPSTAIHSLYGSIRSYSEGYNASVQFTRMHTSRRHSSVLTAWQSCELTILSTIRRVSFLQDFRGFDAVGWATRRGIGHVKAPTAVITRIFTYFWCTFITWTTFRKIGQLNKNRQY